MGKYDCIACPAKFVKQKDLEHHLKNSPYCRMAIEKVSHFMAYGVFQGENV